MWSPDGEVVLWVTYKGSLPKQGMAAMLATQ